MPKRPLESIFHSVFFPKICTSRKKAVNLHAQIGLTNICNRRRGGIGYIMENKEQIADGIVVRSSTAEFLIFQSETESGGVEVFYKDKTIWATQKAMAELFAVDRSVITKHLKNIYDTDELQPDSVCAKFAHTAADGKQYETNFYNLDAIISVGYRVNSMRATQFRRWATFVLKQFTLRGYVLDKKRMENGSYLTEDYFEHLLEEIREIRLSERNFYQKLTDLYATAMDYDAESPITREFFKRVQNKMHYAVHQHTAAELIMERADAERDHMGLTTWEAAPKGKIVKSDVSIAKNYLNMDELQAMGRLVNAYLDIAKDMAERHVPMTMSDWASRIDKFLTVTDRPILDDAGNVSAEKAKTFAESEFEKYRIVQDRLFKSDFDRLIELPFEEKA